MYRIPYKQTYRDWLLTKGDEDTPLGDLARDFAADRCALYGDNSPKTTYRSIYRHIKGDHNDEPWMRELLHESNEQYHTEQIALLGIR